MQLFPFIAIHKLFPVIQKKGYLFYAFRKQPSIWFLGEIFLICFQDHQCNFRMDSRIQVKSILLNTAIEHKTLSHLKGLYNCTFSCTTAKYILISSWLSKLIIALSRQKSCPVKKIQLNVKEYQAHNRAIQSPTTRLLFKKAS